MDDHGKNQPKENNASSTNSKSTQNIKEKSLYFRVKAMWHRLPVPTQTEPPRVLKLAADISRQAVHNLGSKFPILRTLVSDSSAHDEDDYIMEASMIESRRQRIEEARRARREALEGVRRAREMVARKVDEVNKHGRAVVSKKDIEGLEKLVADKQEQLRQADEIFQQEMNHVFFN